MGVNNFDDIIKAKLQELEKTSSKEHDWDYFSSLYDEAMKEEDNLFDEQVASSVSSFQVPYNHNHWSLMKEKLEREEFIRTSIYLSKIVEAGCIFLILFTFLNVFPSHPTSQKQNATDTTIAQNHSLINTPSDLSAQQPLIVPKQNINPYNHKNIASPLNKSKIGPTNNNTLLPQNLPAIPPAQASTTIKDIKPKTENYSSDAVATEITERQNHVKIAQKSQRELKPIAALTDQEIKPLKFIRSFYFPVVPHWYNKGPKADKFVTLSVSPSINIVNSPYDFVYRTDPYTTDALGMGLGVDYSLRRNRFEVEAGLRYARKSYNPRQIRETTGSFNTSYVTSVLKDISFNILSMPVSLKYLLKKSDDVNIFAMAGTSINNVMYADYTIERNGRQVNTNIRSLDFAGKDFNQGILKGGNYFDNLFLSFDFGFGLEKRISGNTYLLIAPTLRQHIGLAGIGPNNDKVNSLSLNLGIKKRL